MCSTGITCSPPRSLRSFQSIDLIALLVDGAVMATAEQHEV